MDRINTQIRRRTMSKIFPESIKEAIAIHHWMQDASRKDIKNTLRVADYKLLKKMCNKLIKTWKNDNENVFFQASANILEEDIDIIDRYEWISVDSAIKAAIHGIIINYDESLDPEGAEKPDYFKEVLEKLVR